MILYILYSVHQRDHKIFARVITIGLKQLAKNLARTMFPETNQILTIRRQQNEAQLETAFQPQCPANHCDSDHLKANIIATTSWVAFALASTAPCESLPYASGTLSSWCGRRMCTNGPLFSDPDAMATMAAAAAGSAALSNWPKSLSSSSSSGAANEFGATQASLLRRATNWCGKSGAWFGATTASATDTKLVWIMHAESLATSVWIGRRVCFARSERVFFEWCFSFGSRSRLILLFGKKITTLWQKDHNTHTHTDDDEAQGFTACRPFNLCEFNWLLFCWYYCGSWECSSSYREIPAGTAISMGKTYTLLTNATAHTALCYCFCRSHVFYAQAKQQSRIIYALRYAKSPRV